MTLEQKKEECLALLRSTKRPKIESLINHITKMGFFKAPGSLRHHRFSTTSWKPSATATSTAATILTFSDIIY